MTINTYLQQTYGERGIPEISGLAREGYPRSQADDVCPWCGSSGGMTGVVVHVRTPTGALGTSAHPGFVHLAHVDCLDGDAHAELAERYAAQYMDPQEPSKAVCMDCLSYTHSEDEMAGLAVAPTGSACWSCLDMLRDSEQEHAGFLTVAAALDERDRVEMSVLEHGREDSDEPYHGHGDGW